MQKVWAAWGSLGIFSILLERALWRTPEKVFPGC